MKTTREKFNEIFDEELSELKLDRNPIITNGTSSQLQGFVNSGGILRMDLSASIAYSLKRREEAVSAKTYS